MKRLFFPILLIFMLLSCMKGGYGPARPDDAAVYADSVAYYRTEGRNQRNSGSYNEALTLHRRGLELAEEGCDTLEVIQALNNIGTVYRRMGLLEEAASWHYRALTVCEEWSDTTSPTALKNRVISLNGIGNVHLSLGNDDMAMDAFTEALKGEAMLGSATGQAINHANIGALHEDRGQLDSARHHYALSLKFNEESGNVLGTALCNNHFGRLAEIEGRPDEALSYYLKAYGLLRDGTDSWHLLQASTSISRIYMNSGRFASAGHYLHEAMEIAEDIDSKAHLVDIYNQKYRLEKSSGDHVDALRWLERYVELSDALEKERNEKEIYNLRATYEKEKNLNERKHLQKAHQQETRRQKIILVSILMILLLASAVIAILVYALWLRSRNHRMLKELDGIKNNYFTNIAHEFRTPLTVIISAARRIGRTSSEDISVKEDSRDILAHSQNLLNLVNQVLEVAKMTSGLAPDPVWRRGNVSGYVSGICERYARYADEKNIRLLYESDEEGMEMDFVPDMIMRITGNLLSNAIKYSGRGTVITVRMKRVLSSGKECLRMEICDNGAGMSPQQLENIFKPFHQASDGANDMSTGIGLSVVKLSVEAMGGTVDVRSAVGEGSDFVVMIPVRHDMAETAFVEEAMEIDENVSEEVVNEDAGESEAPRILIVEDRPEVARWEMRQLDPQYSFCFAADGSEALRKAEEVVPDLIITDVMMPVMDGFEFCRRVRASELLSHIPVVMVTAKATYEDRLKGFEAGADAYIEKPYNEDELALRVRMLLEQREMLRRRFTEEPQGFRDECPVRSAAGKAFIEKFDVALDEAFEKGKVDCEDLASALCIGRVQLNRKMKALTGFKTSEYILNARMVRAKKLLKETDLPVSEIALKCAIEDVGYFSTLFRKNTGMTPSVWRKS